MGNWGYQKSGRQRQVFRAKLYLLAVGILILGALLFREGDRGGGRERRIKDGDRAGDSPGDSASGVQRQDSGAAENHRL